MSPTLGEEDKKATQDISDSVEDEKLQAESPILLEGTGWDALKNPEAYVLPPQMRGYAAQQAEVLRQDAPREQMNVRVRSELKRAAQILAASQKLSLGDVIEEALVDYIKKHADKVRD